MDMTKVSSVSIALSGVALLALGFIIAAFFSQQPAYGSVEIGNNYLATTTAANSLYGANATTDYLVRTGGGTFGSLVITGANTGIINIYDATTTSVLKRTGNKATSTIHIASIPASAAANTFTFDVQFNTGLLIDLDTGLMPTTTITYRAD